MILVNDGSLKSGHVLDGMMDKFSACQKGKKVECEHIKSTRGQSYFLGVV